MCRPSTSRTPEMIEKVRQMLAQDRRLTLILIAEELGISKDTAHIIVRGFKPARVRWIFSESKNPEYDFLRKGSKAAGTVS